jgi:hypothetical protein
MFEVFMTGFITPDSIPKFNRVTGILQCNNFLGISRGMRSQPGFSGNGIEKFTGYK